MKFPPLLIGILSYFIGQLLVFYQHNGQFIWKDLYAKYHWINALAGVIITYFFIWGTKYTVEGMGGLLWPTRFIGFGIGMVIYTILLGIHFNEGVSLKTIISLIICIILIGIQVLWK